MNSMDCPCGSSKGYQSCCGVYHELMNAPTALSLMKSRYSAFSVGDINYLFETTNPNYQSQFDKKSTKKWSKQNTWLRLEIISYEKGTESDKKGKVEFKAYYSDKKGRETIHHELSDFEKIDGKWYYATGIIK